MNRIMNIDDADSDDDEDDDNDFEFWNEDRRHAWDLDEYDEVDHCRVRMKLSEIGSVHAEMSALAKKMKHLVHDLKIMRGSEQSWPHALGSEIRPLFQLTKQMMGLQRTWDRELALVNECVAIRRNDENITKVNNTNGELSLLPLNYGSAIGDCLRCNTHVTDLTVNLRLLRHPNAISTFLRYIQTSRSLLRVSLIAPVRNNSYDALARRFLCALQKSPCISELKYCHVYVPPTEFAALMLSKPTSPIKVLSIEISILQILYTAQEQELLVRSIASSNLTRLQLSVEDHDERNAQVVPIFHHLSNHPTSLSELSLQGCGDDAVSMQAVTEFLQSTETLQHLEFEFCEFDRNTMNCFLDGLKVHYVKPTASITKLSFVDCAFDDEASAMFMQYMQTPVPDPNNNRSRNGTVLQELAMKFRPDQDSFEATFDGKPLGEAMVLLISRVHTKDSSAGDVISNGSSTSRTIGSQLERLSLYPVTAMTDFWTAIASNAERIDIPRLQLSYLQAWDCNALDRHLYKLRSLRELQLTVVLVHDELLVALVRTLRENDSLHSVSVEDCKNHALLNPWVSRFVKASCDRNTYLHELRKNIPRWNEDATHVHMNKRPKLVVPTDHYDKALLIPMLIQSAKQVHANIKLNNVVSALLAFEADCFDKEKQVYPTPRPATSGDVVNP